MPGVKASSPIAINRNEAPQVTARKPSIDHSAGPNDPLFDPSAVLITGLRRSLTARR